MSVNEYIFRSYESFESEMIDVDVHPGLAGWDAPDPRVHRAVNADADIYVEVVTFYPSIGMTLTLTRNLRFHERPLLAGGSPSRRTIRPAACDPDRS